MNWKRIIYDVFIIAAIGFFQFFIVAMVLMTLIDPFFPGISAYLEMYEMNLQGFLFLLLILFIEVVLFKSIWKNTTLLLRIGLGLVFFMGVVPFVYSGIRALDYSSYYQDFDSEKWKNDEVKPGAMVRTIIADSLFVGSNKKEVLEALGGRYNNESNEISYSTNLGGIPLIFQFDEEGELVRYYLREINW